MTVPGAVVELSPDILESIESADRAPGPTAADAARPPGSGSGTGAATPALEARYRAYCRGQAAALLALLPREAVRPLHREARAWADRAGFHHDPTEPLETLLAYCRELLPLPPFDVWRDDLRRNPLAHAELGAASPTSVPGAPSAVTLTARTLERDGETWHAGLRVFAADGVWRGYIVFRCPVGGRHARTATVFREEVPEGVRERFMDLAPATLAAFLRSSLP